MDRIDRALARIETQAGMSGMSTPPGEDDGTSISPKHEALRDRVSASLAELDALIETLER
jgi:hypothetical protein